MIQRDHNKESRGRPYHRSGSSGERVRRNASSGGGRPSFGKQSGRRAPNRHSDRPRTTKQFARKAESVIPSAGENIRIVPLGGVEEVGRNMTVIEYKNDIIVIDAGFQFQEEDTPGIDYILPNTKYLEDRKDKIRGIFITHGHLDHIGGIPYIMDRIGNPPLY